MDVIDGKWIAERLPNDHGIKSRLAAHMGIDQPKLSKIIKGLRQVKPTEAKRAVDFFSALNTKTIAKETRPTPAEPKLLEVQEDAAPFLTKGRSPEHTLSALCYAATTPELFRAEVDLPGFLIAQGDILVVDLSREPTIGELALIAFRDEIDQTSSWGIRRWLGNAMLTGDGRGALEGCDPKRIAMQPRGVIVAVARALAKAEMLAA